MFLLFVFMGFLCVSGTEITKEEDYIINWSPVPPERVVDTVFRNGLLASLPMEKNNVLDRVGSLTPTSTWSVTKDWLSAFPTSDVWEGECMDWGDFSPLRLFEYKPEQGPEPECCEEQRRIDAIWDEWECMDDCWKVYDRPGATSGSFSCKCQNDDDDDDEDD